MVELAPAFFLRCCKMVSLLALSSISSTLVAGAGLGGVFGLLENPMACK